MSSLASSSNTAFSFDQIDGLLRDLSMVFHADDIADLKPTPVLAGSDDALLSASTTSSSPPRQPPTPPPLQQQPPQQMVYVGRPVAVQPPPQQGASFRWGSFADGSSISVDVESDGVTDSPPVSPSPVASRVGALGAAFPAAGGVAAAQGAPAVEAPKFRTKVCRSWAAGLPCSFGDRCAFAHGDSQIRKREDPNPFNDVYYNGCVSPTHGLSKSSSVASSAGSFRRVGSKRQHGRQAAAAAATVQGAPVPQQRCTGQGVVATGVPLMPHVAAQASVAVPESSLNYTDTTGCVWFN